MPRVRAVTPTVAEELRDLKARYFHYVDLKQWDELRGLFVDDCVFEG
ncbi:nuclear transport factor 2 family protein, partial [Escherichia coli]